MPESLARHADNLKVSFVISGKSQETKLTSVKQNEAQFAHRTAVFQFNKLIWYDVKIAQYESKEVPFVVKNLRSNKVIARGSYDLTSNINVRTRSVTLPLEPVDSSEQ